jgi:hypothetical protein
MSRWSVLLAHPDLDALLNPLLTFAQQQVSRRKGFFPFGARMSSAGEISLVAGDIGNEQPDPTELITFLVDVFRREAAEGAIRAVGICVDMRVTPPGSSEKTDAVCAQLEHISGECGDVYLPYRKGFLGRIKWGQLFAVTADGRVFGSRETGPRQAAPDA